MIRITRITRMNITSIFLNSCIWMSRCMNQTYFECFEFDANAVLILISTCTYKSLLNWVRMNQSSWISILLTYLYSLIWWVLKSSEKASHCWSLVWKCFYASTAAGWHKRMEHWNWFYVYYIIRTYHWAYVI